MSNEQIHEEDVREMPASVDAERAILGALLLDSLNYAEVSGSKLVADHFSLDAHRKIYAAMCAIAEAGKTIDLISLGAELKPGKQLAAVGGLAYLSSLTDGLARRVSIEQYIRLVKDKALLRSIVHLTTSMQAAAFEQYESGAELLAIIDAKITQLRNNCVTITAQHAGELIVEAMNRWTEIREKAGDDCIGYTTSIRELDEATTGIQSYEYWVIGARPNIGKTPLLMQIALANAQRGVNVGVFSEEMSGVQLMFRLMAHAAIASSGHMRRPQYMSEGEFGFKRNEGIKQISNLPLWIWKGQRTIADITAEARMAIHKHGIQLLIVDYLQQTDAPGKSEFERVTNVSRGLDKLIDKTGVPIVTASQLNRDAKDPKRKPQLGDLRMSGQIEQDADVVVLIHREPNEHDEPTDKGELLIAKQREGERTHIPVTFDKKTLRFVERVEQKTTEQIEMPK